ncbi:NADH-quinone oxidoreductase subunit L [Bradyrhizobium sp.]|uniref:NADH-quinone oxidoreductase subunit L n=1 Tax=Bradyrhizobium sp. TaxID=376 RepID=UPI003C4DDABC
MFSPLAFIPAFPLLGFAILFVTAGLLPKRWITTIGVGSVGISALLALIVMFAFLGAPQPYTKVVWTWIAVSGLTPHVGFYLDALSGLMMLVITFVSFLIHLYSAEFMSADEGYSRYFAYMNLFVASMLVLVLADNLLFLYLGWEGVGLCSYLLIGFWYRDPANGLAARKAFIVTRVGDTAMAIGVFVLFTNLGTLDIQPLMQQAVVHWPVGSALPIAAAALLLGGAVGKSAQLPLQTWLPDAMAGPTPVSALIHAATMVTAGVYLIARTHVLYDLAPPVHTAVAVIGALTLLLAGFSALNQTDLKRILAYSTISQIGYMFLALGVGAWSAAIFHFMTHAFFKALLFLSAGVVVQRLGDEHDIFRMGGLRERLPLAFWSFFIGSISLAALPLIDAGFYSKDLILWEAWSDGALGPWLWAAGLFGALLTAIYIFRAVFVVFFGPLQLEPTGPTGWRIAIPLVVLSILALTGGFVEIPPYLGNVPAFSELMQSALPAPRALVSAGSSLEVILSAIAAAVAILGVGIAYIAFRSRPAFLQALVQSPASLALQHFWETDWGFDWLYDRALVRPFLWFARIDQGDFIDRFYTGLASLSRLAYRQLSESETGRVRRYAAGITAGSIVLIAMLVFA